MADLKDIALKLAKEHAPDLVPVNNLISLDGIILENIPTLMPGLDYRDGVVYMTFPFQRNVTKQVSKRPPIFEEKIELQTICITSKREAFWFEEQELRERNWNWPRTFMQNPNAPAWNGADLDHFLRHPTEAPDPRKLYEDIHDIYEEYIEFSEPAHYDLMSVYVMLTYVFRLFQAVGYIHFHGTREAGKSQNMAILNALAFNPLWQSSITPASLFRTLGGSVGTMMIDEAERWESEGDQELLRILKAGYYEGSGVGRVERDSNDRFTAINYPAYSPKVIASINPQDPTLTSRCIVITMTPAARTLPNFDFKSADYAPYRNRLYLWAMHHTKKIEDTIEGWQEEKRHKYVPALRNRQWQIALPILAVAEYVGGEELVERLATFLTNYWASATRNQNVMDKQALLLRSLPRLMRDKSYQHEFYYKAKDIHSIVTEFLDEEEAKTYKTRSVLRNLSPLGFGEKRNSKEGILVQIKEEDVRKSFTQRRIEPFDEDVDWLAGTTSYQSAPTALPKFDWSAVADEEDTG